MCDRLNMSVSDAEAERAGAVLAALIGTGLVVLSWQPLGRLFAPDRDSVFVTYLALGLPLLLPGFGLWIYAANVWRRSADAVTEERGGRRSGKGWHLARAALLVAGGLGGVAVVAGVSGHVTIAKGVAAAASLSALFAGTFLALGNGK